MTRQMGKRLCWLPGARRLRMYLSAGDSLQLKRHLQFMGGIRGLIEDLVVTVVGKSGVSLEVGNDEVLNAYQELSDLIKVDAAMLLYTGWYKNTVFVGPVRGTDGCRYFAKSFKLLSDAREEATKAKSVRTLADGYFKTAGVQNVQGRVILYELVEHGQSVPDARAVEAACLAMCTASLLRSVDAKPLKELVDFGALLGFCAQFPWPAEGLISALERIQKQMSVPVELCFAHGDFTPWNTFSSPDDSICLIDYENFFCGTPYFDYFHYHCQPGAMVNDLSPANMAFERLNDGVLRASAMTRIYFLAYLILQIYADLEAWCKGGMRHRQLSMLIKSRATLIKMYSV